MTTSADEQQLAELTAWIQQFAAARQRIEDNLSNHTQAAWRSFESWYDTQAVTKLANEISALSTQAQDIVAGAAEQYVANVTALMRGSRAVQVSRVTPPPIRNGADLLRVHTRPAEVFRLKYARTEDSSAARDAAALRAVQLTQTDVMLASRGAQHEEMRALGVDRYRRILHPELAKDGQSCGLCVVAADRIYKIGTLLPIHGGCHCETLEVTDSHDPGLSLNTEDLQRIYAAAGSTAGEDLKRIRVTVNDHGELGPVLTRHGDSFRGPQDVPLEQDPERAGRMLDQVKPVLDSLEARAAAGEDVAEPLTYQRELAARLDSIVAAAA